MGRGTHIPMKMNITTTRSFKQEDQNSSSAKPSVPNRLAITKQIVSSNWTHTSVRHDVLMTTQKTVIHPAIWTLRAPSQ